MSLVMLLVLGAWPFVAPQPDDKVVATVEGPRGAFTITAGRLTAYAKENPDRAPKQLLQDLIDFELLAAEASTRKYSDDALREDLSAAIVQAYLRKEFEPNMTAAKIPMHYVRLAYDRNIWRYTHPTLRKGQHILVTTKASKRPVDPALDAKAKALAERITADAIAQKPKGDFARFAEGYKAEAKAMGLQVRGEGLGYFALEKEKRHFTDEFTERAFELPIGVPNPPFPTAFGYHVVKLSEEKPAVDISFEEAEPGIRKRILDEVRSLEMKKLVQSLGAKYGALDNVDALKQLEARRGL